MLADLQILDRDRAGVGEQHRALDDVLEFADVVLANKIAAIRNAAARIDAVRPATAEAFASNRTAREVVAFKLFLAVQEAIALAFGVAGDESADLLVFCEQLAPVPVL